MKKKTLFNSNDEIDLINLTKIIWDHKLKFLLIVAISFIIGQIYSFKKHDNYLNSLTMDLSNTNELTQLRQITELIGNDGKLPTNQIVLDEFIDELKDYQEFLLSIKNSKKIEGYSSKISVKDQEEELSNYAKLFHIIEPKINEKKYIINFIWDDPYEAKKILKNTFDLTSKNLKKKYHERLSNELEFKKKITIHNDNERLIYLYEQSAIARELGIEDNQVDFVNQSTDIAYYLRGYKAIEKEIELIKNRNYENLKFKEQELDNFKNLGIEFVKINLFTVEAKPLKKTTMIFAISILLGLIVGIFFIFIYNLIQIDNSLKKNKQKV